MNEDYSIKGQPTESQEKSTTIVDMDTVVDKKMRYKEGTKVIELGKNKSFHPKKGEIYLDNSNNQVFRILSDEEKDAAGNRCIAVETPQLSDVFESYTISKQTIELNEANIDYMILEVTKVDISTASAASGDAIQTLSDSNGDVHTFKIDKLMLFEYPESDSKAESTGTVPYRYAGLTKDERQRAKEEENASDLDGVDEEDRMNIKIWIEDATILITNPTVTADADLLIPTPFGFVQDVNIEFNAIAKVDATVFGNLKFKKVIEKCVYGYCIQVPHGSAFVGIFLVVDVSGKINV